MAEGFLTFIWANFLIGMLSFGGGKAFIPIFQQVYVDDYQIVDQLKLTEVIGYSTALPGPIAPMIIGVIGFQKYGFLGFFLGIIVMVVPLVLLFFAMWKVYKKYHETQALKSISKYISPAIIALLLSVVLGSFNVNYGINYLIYNVLSFTLASYLFIKYDPHPILMIILFGIASYFIL